MARRTRPRASATCRPASMSSLCVTDTGTGMPPEVIAKAFDPFFTTKPIGAGHRAGLSMIYGFVAPVGRAGAHLFRVGQGHDDVPLPAAPSSATRTRRAPTPIAAPPDAAARGETVLVVDDEPTVRMLIAEVLEELGYAAIEAADGPAGLKVLQSDARIDLLITDVGLPGGMNGRQVADAARILRPGSQGAVHHRLRGERRGRQRSPDAGHGGDHQAVRHGRSGQQDQRTDRGSNQLSMMASDADRTSVPCQSWAPWIAAARSSARLALHRPVLVR